MGSTHHQRTEQSLSCKHRDIMWLQTQFRTIKSKHTQAGLQCQSTPTVLVGLWSCVTGNIMELYQNWGFDTLWAHPCWKCKDSFDSMTLCIRVGQWSIIRECCHFVCLLIADMIARYLGCHCQKDVAVWHWLRKGTRRRKSNGG